MREWIAPENVFFDGGIFGIKIVLLDAIGVGCYTVKMAANKSVVWMSL